ncbi:MAG: CocE/NonD family hydrolase [Bryobacteraceae bacterium]
MTIRTGLLPTALAIATCGVMQAQGVEYIKAHYTKYEYEIPMRDGVHLYTAVYRLKHASKLQPILLTRTPYAIRPYGEDQYPVTLGPSELFAKEGYTFVYQDVRGRYRSEGKFEHVRPHIDKKGPKDIDESTDTWDTIDWLLKHVASNGKVGMWGISYPGFYVTTGMMSGHPALAAVSPQAPVGDWFIGDDFHHNGALYLAHAFRWFAMNDRIGNDRSGDVARRDFDFPSPDGYRMFLELQTLSAIDEKFLKGSLPFWTQMREHPNYDEFWQARDVRRHLKGIRPPVLNVGGWFDAEDLFGTLATYQGVERGGPASFNSLVMGPWYHGGWSRSEGLSMGAVQFGSKTGEFYREKIEFPFFQYYLKGVPNPDLPKAYMFETGANEWRKFDQWPPRQVKPTVFYLRENSGLQAVPPPADSPSAFDEYVSDPSRPVPYIPSIANTMTREHMLDDQRFATTRPDVLVFETEPLKNDLTVAGPILASLHVSTTGTDSDWVVKVIDVYPNNLPDPDPNPLGLKMGGYQQLIRGELVRGRYRRSFERPEAMKPGEIAKIEYTLPDIFHTFRRGHRLMVHIQSSWFPLVDLNPQTFVDIYHAKRSDFKKATQRVYRSAHESSSIQLQILPPAN